MVVVVLVAPVQEECGAALALSERQRLPTAPGPVCGPREVLLTLQMHARSSSRDGGICCRDAEAYLLAQERPDLRDVVLHRILGTCRQRDGRQPLLRRVRLLHSVHLVEGLADAEDLLVHGLLHGLLHVFVRGVLRLSGQLVSEEELVVVFPVRVLASLLCRPPSLVVLPQAALHKEALGVVGFLDPPLRHDQPLYHLLGLPPRVAILFRDRFPHGALSEGGRGGQHAHTLGHRRLGTGNLWLGELRCQSALQLRRASIRKGTLRGCGS